MKQTIIVSFIIALLVISGCSTQRQVTEKAANAAGTSSNLKIGVVYPATGSLAFYGIPSMKGMEMALKDLKEKYGDEVTVLFEDTKSDNKEAVTAARKLLDVDEADVIITAFTGPSVALAPIVLEKNKLFVYAALTPKPMEANPYGLKFFPNAYDECKKLAAIGKAKGYKTVAGVIAQGDFNQPCKDAVSSEFPAARFYDFPPGSNDMRDILTKIQHSPVDFIVSLGYEQNFIALFTQKKEMGILAPEYCGNKNDCFGDKIQSLGGESLNGTVTFDYSVREVFANRYLTENPGASKADLNPAAEGYDMMMYSYLTAKQCPKRDGPCMAPAAQKVDYETQVVSSGFGDGRILKLETLNEEYVDGKMVEVKTP